MMAAPDIPRPDRVVLDDLVRLAGDIVTRPAVRAAQWQRVAAIGAEVDAAIRRPADSVRVVDDEAAMLVKALDRMVRAPGSVADPQYLKWAQLAGVLLASVHAAAARAAEVELGA